MAPWGLCRVGRCAAVGRVLAAVSLTRDLQESVGRKPLFPGSNELNQILKIHDVTGILANKALHKFKQSRIARLGFSFKKGKGIPPVMYSLPSKDFSLLYAMIKYDPDERIAAHQALQHPYFQEL